MSTLISTDVNLTDCIPSSTNSALNDRGLPMSGVVTSGISMDASVASEECANISTTSLEGLTLPTPSSTVGPENFEKIRILGAGSTGRVYLVRSVGLAKDEYYAMKVVKKSELVRRNRVQRILAERHILTTTNHPFIVTLNYCFQTADFFYLVMQYCAGGEFYAILRKQPECRLSEDSARFYAAEVLVALEYLHMLGIIYRDLKPENILVHESGHVMLADFDLAHELKPVSSTGTGQSLTQRRGSTSTLKRTSTGANTNDPPLSPTISTSDRALGSRLPERRVVNIAQVSSGSTVTKQPATEHKRGRRSSCPCFSFPMPIPSYPLVDTESHMDSGEQRTSFVGTHEYVAPEIIAEEEYTRSVDWWAFGILLYEMVYGRTPFRGQNQIQTLENILDISDFIDFPKDVPVSESCRDLIQQLLAKTVSKRLQNPLFIKSHPFFEGVVWPLIRHQTAPLIPTMVHHHDEREYTIEEMESFDHEVPFHRAIVRSPLNASIAVLVDKAGSSRFTAATPPASPSRITCMRTLGSSTRTEASSGQLQQGESVLELHDQQHPANTTSAETANTSKDEPNDMSAVVSVDGFEYVARHERHYWSTAHSHRSLTDQLSKLGGLTSTEVQEDGQYDPTIPKEGTRPGMNNNDGSYDEKRSAELPPQLS